MAVSWQELLMIYLHDPPDKALDIKGHLGRASRYASAALGQRITPDDQKHTADQLASSIERLPMPLPGPNYEYAVGPESGKLTVFHNLSAASLSVAAPMPNEEEVRGVIEEITRGSSDQWKFFAMWRLLPERLGKISRHYSHLPADTRTPDHTIWQHLDITAAYKAALDSGKHAALLSFSLGPVQSFIATARTLRDLWSGSMILSWLTFRAMLPIIEQLGPTALIYPSLRGIPLLDLWLRHPKRLGTKIEELSIDQRRLPCLPNRFLALVPYGVDGVDAKRLADQCVKEAEHARDDLARRVHDILDKQLKPLHDGWDRRWWEQIHSYFEMRTAIVPLAGEGGDKIDRMLAQLLSGKDEFGQAFDNAERVREMARHIPEKDKPRYLQDHAGRWQYQVELSARLMQAQRALRHIPPHRSHSPAPPKCSLLGTYEQMGPDGLDDSRRFWEGENGSKGASASLKVPGIRLRSGERLCAIGLLKRFAPTVLGDELELSPEDMYYEDVASIAAAPWLAQHPRLEQHAKLRKSASWLHWSRPNQEEDEQEIPPEIWQELLAARKDNWPPIYYAVLVMDGDHMGKWLRGEKSPAVKDVMHPKLVEYFKGLSKSGKSGLDAQRPVGPALHAAISEALANFALHGVPAMVNKNQGTLVYAGGDDVLALLPACSALPCILQLRQAFKQDWAEADGIERLFMGNTATVSAGISIVHVKEDLRFALQTARDAEKKAKNSGRDILQMTVCRRSGEHASILCPWETIDHVEALSRAFKDRASDRWAYHLAAELETLTALPPEAILAEISRQVNRSENVTRNKLANALGGDPRDPGQALAKLFEGYRLALEKREIKAAEAFGQFIKLCQTASFLVRGRDR
jgi:CRISPR-associated protein Cmr2